MIYVLVDPRDHEIRYVGKTKFTNLIAKRDDHVYKALYAAKVNMPRYTWIRKLRRLGLTPDIVKVQDVDNQHINDAERYWITYFRDLGCALTNATPGGDGFVGARHTEETKAKIRLALIGKSWLLGASDEARERHREVSRQNGRKRRGARLGPEARVSGSLTAYEEVRTYPRSLVEKTPDYESGDQRFNSSRGCGRW